MRCLKTLYKITFLEPAAVQIPDIWTGITAEMRARQEVPGLREQAWKTFRNAFLYQPTFGAFLMGNPDLGRKVGDCFSSLEESVTACMVTTLPSLARPLADSMNQNLADLWVKLAEPSVLIAGKIRSMYKSCKRGSSGAVRTALVDFVLCVLDAMSMKWSSGEPLVAFITAPHIWAELSGLIREIAELFDRKGMLFG
jgi:hypothetical protein